MRCWIVLRSNCAKAPHTLKINRPIGVEVQDRKAAGSTKPLATHGRTIHSGQQRLCRPLARHVRSTSVSR
jgi:hypothetical protein